MKTKYILNSFLAFLLVIQVSKAQDIHFSQYTETPSSINPALAGVHYNTRVTANFRTQWGSVATSYQTIGLSFEQTIKAKKIKGSYFAFALNIFRDAAGDAKLNTLNPNLGFGKVHFYGDFAGKESFASNWIQTRNLLSLIISFLPVPGGPGGGH